ncbi:hypothetical protein SISNIDRAFT_209577 [Sistotremastrum niveocremeum HHB9708]|uniref:Autophagy-related protein 13 n=1 Tax=Sistotremastrum niveocremeum HHB9708 TaxID=1314777 RepID=A0A164QZH4_9AGAM|nr:hypothetical protein SISNIDRAFT_209577 [Sistotremastrum niveocremeum HHB9708]
MAESTQRANAIARNIFSKFVAVVSNARITNAPEQDNVKQDKWFNLETPDPHLFKDNLRLYHSISTLSSPPPPLELQVLLSVPELTTNQALVLVDSQSSRARVVPTPRYVLLESWVLVFNPSHPESPSPYHEEVALSAVYKQSISLFRSLFTLMRVLPAWSLFKRLRRRGASSRTANLGIQVSIGEDATGILGFDKPLSPNTQPLRTSTHSFPSVSHPLGTLTLHTTYLNDSTFEIDTVESLLSSRFLSDDEFTPTLVSRNSLHSTSSPGSLPMRQSIPRPPLVQPTTTSIADRFILRGNANASNTSLTSPSPLPVASIPTSRQPSSLSSSPKDAVPFPNPNRVRRESLLSKHSALSTEISPTGVTPPSPQGVPLRRPSITSPFRGPTIASSPSSASFRQASPLSSAGFNTGAGASLPSRPPPVSPRLVPGTLRPSPPNQFTPSSLGDGGARRSSFGQSSSEASGPPPGIGGATGTLPTGISRPTGKRRFSSTFGHRYSSSIGAASIGGSDGSGGSVEKKDVADALLPGGRPAVSVSLPSICSMSHASSIDWLVYVNCYG